MVRRMVGSCVTTLNPCSQGKLVITKFVISHTSFGKAEESTQLLTERMFILENSSRSMTHR